MPRPFKKRRICGWYEGAFFKPRGIPLRQCEIIVLQIDELEALKQAHIFGKTQTEGAESMGISRSTFQRILEQAHLKVTTALTENGAIQIEGGPVRFDIQYYLCRNCGYRWNAPFQSKQSEVCPNCGAADIDQLDSIPPHHNRGRGGHGHCGGNRL
ncbi:DUF134 domain-containing protein [bacterium]|nr:DUF134 domain-containing protein [bacterium]